MQPVGVPVLVGAFIFGIGMQLGGGCASGTLFTVGGGNTRMVVTLLFFIVGSLLGTAHSAFWGSLPTFPATSLVRLYGPVAALAMSLVVFGAHLRRSRWRSSGASSGGWWKPTPAPRPQRWLRGPWPLVAGAIGLAAVNLATLLLAGRPWGVTSAFALWGAKAASAVGVPVETWPYWSSPGQLAALSGSVFGDVTTRDGLRHRPRRAAGGAAGRPVRAGVVDSRHARWRPP